MLRFLSPDSTRGDSDRATSRGGFVMRYFVTIDDREFEVKVGADRVSIDGQELEVSIESSGVSSVRSLLVGSRAHKILGDRSTNGEWSIHLDGLLVEAHVLDERTRAIRGMTQANAHLQGPKPVVAPMPGMVLKVEVGEGDRVESGQGIIIVEAMKMENEVRAYSGGLVTRVHVKEGEAVEKGQILVDLGPLKASGAHDDTC